MNIRIGTILLLVALLVVTACDKGIDPPPPEDSDVTITLNPIDAQSRDVLTEATHHDTTTDDVIAVGAGEIKREEDTELAIRTENDGYEPTTTQITFNHNRTVTISLRSIPEDPDEVTVTYRIQNEAGEIVEDAALAADSLADRGPEGAITFPFSNTETVELCGTADWYENDCVELTPNEDQEILLTLARETVSVSITPEIAEYSDILHMLRRENPVTWPGTPVIETTYYLSIGDSTWVDNLEMHNSFDDYKFHPFIGEGITTTIEYPAGPDPIPVSVRAEYVSEDGHPYSDEHYLNVAEGSTELPGNSDSNVELTLEHIPACRDEVDNTFSGEMDAENIGCTELETGQYDPDDDVELVKGLSRTGGFGAPGFSAYIADAPGERVGPAGNGPPHPAIHYAMGPVEVLLQTKWDSDDDQQAAAIQLRCGPRGNLPDEPTGISEITHDTAADGWQMMQFDGLTRQSYAGGAYCERLVVHASKVQGEEPGDGEGRIEITNAEMDGAASRTERFFFQPEDVPDSKQTAAAAKAEDAHIEVEDIRDLKGWRTRPVKIQN